MKHKITDIIGGILAYIFISFVVFACIWGNPFKDDFHHERKAVKTYLSEADKAIIKMREADDEK